MPERIRVEVGGVGAGFVLREDVSPKTAAALLDSLPIEAPIRHVKNSGSACYFDVHEGPVASLAERPELPVTSIYKGWLVAFPDPTAGRTEFLISYGLAEYRWPTGRRLVSPIAELEGEGREFFDALKRIHAEGEKTVTVRREEG
jgi:hypothetical protein